MSLSFDDQSAHTHAHCYPLFESGTKTSFGMITLLSKHSKKDFSNNNNWCTVRYIDLISGIL